MAADPTEYKIAPDSTTLKPEGKPTAAEDTATLAPSEFDHVLIHERRLQWLSGLGILFCCVSVFFLVATYALCGGHLDAPIDDLKDAQQILSMGDRLVNGKDTGKVSMTVETEFGNKQKRGFEKLMALKEKSEVKDQSGVQVIEEKREIVTVRITTGEWSVRFAIITLAIVCVAIWCYQAASLSAKGAGRGGVPTEYDSLKAVNFVLHLIILLRMIPVAVNMTSARLSPAEGSLGQQGGGACFAIDIICIWMAVWCFFFSFLMSLCVILGPRLDNNDKQQCEEDPEEQDYDEEYEDEGEDEEPKKNDNMSVAPPECLNKIDV